MIRRPPNTTRPIHLVPGTPRFRSAGNLFNDPGPPGMTDPEMDALIGDAIGPLVEGFRPDALVVQCGADALADDPLGHQNLSNGALWRAVRAMGGLAPRDRKSTRLNSSH